MLVATRSTPRKINLVFQPVRVIFCQPTTRAKPCIIFIASNKVGNKNAFVTWQPLHRFLQPHQASASFGSRPGKGKDNKKCGAFRKSATSSLSFLFNVLATGFLRFSSPAPASHYKYDEQRSSFFLPLIAQARFFSSRLLLNYRTNHSSWTTQNFVNFIFCSNSQHSGHPGVPAPDGGCVARGGGGGGGEHPPQLRPR